MLHFPLPAIIYAYSLFPTWPLNWDPLLATNYFLWELYINLAYQCESTVEMEKYKQFNHLRPLSFVLLDIC